VKLEIGTVRVVAVAGRLKLVTAGGVESVSTVVKDQVTGLPSALPATSVTLPATVAV
jgi:hypothetical protein